jgi:hypothetical protein
MYCKFKKQSCLKLASIKHKVMVAILVTFRLLWAFNSGLKGLIVQVLNVCIRMKSDISMCSVTIN